MQAARCVITSPASEKQELPPLCQLSTAFAVQAVSQNDKAKLLEEMLKV